MVRHLQKVGDDNEKNKESDHGWLRQRGCHVGQTTDRRRAFASYEKGYGKWCIAK